ncbi:protein OXIDATIVE STRESS 3-like [Solanum dulcamara]|uniref:protein OXIDATIVE STRESS 3-like n=1 Tax=Solanum dulcamara TaxID=45834 RepID=UPI0024865EF4|nr:protein OXIDATIVE STRESS 3-like [Solanum dulcamara]
MGDSKIEMFKDECDNYMENKSCSSWMINEDNNSPSSSSIGETSSTISSLTSLETTDDASSPASRNSSDGALSDLSTLMAQLPIKRGLSEYYDGKSESFTCLARVTSVEDLPKKESRYTRKMNNSSYKSHTLPKPVIFKKALRSSFLSSCYTARKPNSSISRRRLPLVPVQRT